MICLRCMKEWLALVRENGSLNGHVTVRDMADLIDSFEGCPHATTSPAPTPSAPIDADRRELGRLAFEAWRGGSGCPANGAWLSLSPDQQRRWCDSADAVRRKVLGP